MTNSYHLNNRAFFDKALNIVSDVPPNTPRIEVACGDFGAVYVAVWRER